MNKPTRKSLAIRSLLGGLVVASMATLLPDFAVGQEREGREGREGRGGPRGGFDPAEMLKRMDANGNGMIDPTEASGRMQSFIQRAASGAGLDPAQPLPIDKLTEAMNAQRSERGERGDRGDRGGPPGGAPGQVPGEPPGAGGPPMGPPGSTPPGSTAPGAPGAVPSATTPSTPEPARKIPGFGTDKKIVPVSGFDGRPVTNSKPLEQRFDPRVIEYVDREILGKYDTNKDTYLDSEEWKANTWSTPPETSDTDKDKRLSREELCVRLAAKFGVAPVAQEGGGEKGGDRESRRDRDRGGDKNSADKFKGFAESLIKQHDKDNDGYLKGDELKSLKDDQRAADANGDGVITVDELTVKLASYQPGQGGAPSGGPPSRRDRSDRSGGGPSSGGSPVSASNSPVAKRAWWKNAPAGGSDKSVERRGVRVLSPTERLPKGLPDWFTRADADGDGQVIMTEYAASWSESKVAEFQRYDYDSDGIITPEECLATEGKKSSK